MTNNPFTLPNVNPDPSYGDMDKTGLACTRSILAETIWLCATKFPLWRFNAKYISTYNFVTTFEVRSNGELLGTIESHQIPSSGAYCVEVTNERIANTRARGKAFRTTNPKSAFDKVRKTFGRKNPTERLTDALAAAKDKLSGAQYDAQRKFERADNKHSTTLFDFAKLPNIYEQFVAYAEHNEAAAKVLADLEETKLAMQTINDVRAKYNKPESVLVIRDEGEYIVRYHDSVQIFDDGTMPHEIRARLGMLKLVDPGKAIDGFGFRVSEEVYVVLTVGDDGTTTNE